MRPKKVLVTGATGFIGSQLVRELQKRGDDVTVLLRSPDQVERFSQPIRAVTWDQPAAACAGQDAVVHLAGEQAVGVRWDEAAKARILSSRVDTTRALVSAIASADLRPRVLVSASAVGYYGAREGGDLVDESGVAGSDFLAQVCAQWEAAAQAAQASNVRVVRARLGVVFGRGGGALQEMAKPFRLFAGGPIASGKQVVSWVHRADVIGIILRCIDDESISGPVNVVAPEPVTQGELAGAIGRVLRRPSWLRVPGAALRLRFGEGADPLLTGQRVVPARMHDAGYVWQHADLEAALREALS
jgi:uncharacterized protein (TIGR01777 family)